MRRPGLTCAIPSPARLQRTGHGLGNINGVGGQAHAKTAAHGQLLLRVFGSLVPRGRGLGCGGRIHMGLARLFEPGENLIDRIQ